MSWSRKYGVSRWFRYSRCAERVAKCFAFRVDAAGHIGLGHLRRCVSLAQFLSDAGGDCVFVLRDWEIDVDAVLGNFAKTAVLLPKASEVDPGDYTTWVGTSLEEDAEQFSDALGRKVPDWVIVDHYGIDARWHNQIRTNMARRIAVIDDLANRLLDCDLIIDQNWHTDHDFKYRKVNVRGAQVLGGPRYAMLDRIYAQAPKWELRHKVETIGVFMGGSDAVDAMSQALDLLDQVGFEGRVKAVLGNSNPATAQLRKRAEADPRIELLASLPNLATFFSQCDIQIGAGGSATWERCCIGAPTLALVCAENQRAILNMMSAAGYQWGAELYDQSRQRELLNIALSDAQAREEMSKRCQQLVDGHGGERVARLLLADEFSEVHVRDATMQDAELMYRWRNDARIREVSREGEKISLTDHMLWLEASLSRPDRIILIGLTANNNPIGVVRFDALAQARFEVSIYLDPERIGGGIGRALLAAAEKELVRRTNSPIDIIAVILAGNRVSEGLFLNGGYRPVGDHFEKHRLN